MITLLLVSGEVRPPQRESCRQAVMALALEAVLHPVLQVCCCMHDAYYNRLYGRHLLLWRVTLVVLLVDSDKLAQCKCGVAFLSPAHVYMVWLRHHAAPQSFMIHALNFLSYIICSYMHNHIFYISLFDLFLHGISSLLRMIAVLSFIHSFYSIDTDVLLMKLSKHATVENRLQKANLLWETPRFILKQMVLVLHSHKTRAAFAPFEYILC